MKLISVVIPVLNRAGLISATLDSLVPKAPLPMSVIVVDNGSTDGTAQVVSRWAEAHKDYDFDLKLVTEPRRGASRARNRGLKEVTTPWVMFFDSDDLMLPGHMERICEAIASAPEADLIGWDVRLSTGKRLLFSTDPWSILFHGSMATLRWGARTKLVKEVGGWNENLSLWDDIELGSRMVAKNPSTRKLSGVPTAEVAVSDDAITKREHTLDREAIESALSSLGNALPQLRPWIPFKRVIVAGYNYAGNPEESRRMLEKSISELPSRSALLRFIWTLSRLKTPGITYITNLFIKRR